MTLETVFAALDRLGCRPRWNRDKLVALCPIHELDGQQHRPSLAVWVHDRAICVKCFAGCETRLVRDALGLSRGRPRHNGRSFTINLDPSAAHSRWLRFLRQIVLPPDAPQLDEFAQQVPGTTPEGWHAMRAGLYNGAIAVPMFGPVGPTPPTEALKRPCGVRLRFADGRKLSVGGSKSGLFLPRGLVPETPIVICEGLSDTAAAVSLGLPAIGLPSAGAAHDLLVQAVQLLRAPRVVLALDSDEAGRKAAERLARQLWWFTEVCSLPLTDHKDLRALITHNTAEATTTLKDLLYG